MASTPVLVADCVSKAYGDRVVLSSATLRAVPYQVRVVFGRNGIGKSTLLKIAGGRLQPDSGVVHYRQQAIARASLSALARRGVFYLPDHDLLSSAFSLATQLGFFHDRYGGTPVGEASRLAGVSALLGHRPHQLSSGELRRAEVAAVLVRRPTCLLADEPLRGIAPIDQEHISDLLRGLAADGCAVVVTGHEVPALLDVADHITWSTSGTTYELGPPEAARANEIFLREYLGPHLLGRRRGPAADDP